MNLDSEPEIIFKWTNLCRLCLSPDSHIDLFSSDVNSQDCLSKIRSCLNLLMYYGDPMPSKLCSGCQLKLDEWCEFKKKCVESESQVRKRLQPYKDIKFVKEYFERCAKFESSEIVSSSCKSVSGSIQNSEEVNSSASAQEYTEDSGQLEQVERKVYNDSKEIQETVTSENIVGSTEVTKLEILEKSELKKEWVESNSESLGTIISVTGRASALWDTQKQNEELNYCFNSSDKSDQDKCCHSCGTVFETEEEFDLHSCCLIGSSNNLEDDDGHFEDSISFESEGETVEGYVDYLNTDNSECIEPLAPVKITPWKCIACKLYFQSSLDLRRHYSTISCLGKKCKAFSCEFCFRQFPSLNELLQHQVVHIIVKIHLTEDDLLCCNQCPQQFPNEKRLKNHLLAHALKRKQPIKYTCSQCSQVFFLKVLYESHLASHKDMDITEEPSTESKPMEVDPPNEGPSTTLSTEITLQEEPKKPQGAIRCFRCGQMFASVKQLEHHETIKHKNPTPYICRKCCLRFSARSQLLMHLRDHVSKSNTKTSPTGEGNEQANTCPTCDAKFLLESDLESHMKTHKLPSSEPSSPVAPQTPDEAEGNSEMYANYKCSLCSRLYVRANSCIRHGQQSHKGEKVVPLKLKRAVFLGRRTSLAPGGKVKHKCSKCPKYFFSFNAYSIHAYRSHGMKMSNPKDDSNSLETEDVPNSPKAPDEIVSKCPFCYKDIKPSYISLHIKKFHRGEVLDPSLMDKDIPMDACVCRYCLKQCSTPHNRKLHESIHYPMRAQKNQCETCGQKFTEQADYEDHTRTCKSIRCGKCHKIFFKFINLTQHSCTGTKSEEAHKCTVCLSVFTSLDLLQIHIKNFHGKKAESSNPQPGTSSRYAAKKLERELWREESNKIICMVGEKFYCTFCDCEFSTIQESNEHRATHPRGNWYAVQISDSLFQCTICDKFFESRKSSLLHINYHKKNLLPDHPKPYQMSLEPEVEILTENVQNVSKPADTPKAKKYNCRFCSAGFRDEEDLQDHLLETHVNRI